MSSSGLIYAVIVGAWAAYLVPMWLRRQDELNESRPTERFSTAIRLLAGRSAMERRAARTLGDQTDGDDGTAGVAPDLDPGSGLGSDAGSDADAGAGFDAVPDPARRPDAARPYEPAPESVPEPTREPERESESEPVVAPVPRLEAPHGQGGHGQTAHGHGSHASGHPQGAASVERRARLLARRRRMVTALFLAFALGAIAAAVSGVAFIWLPMIPALLLTLYIGHLRRLERQRYEVKFDRARAAQAAERLRARERERAAADRDRGSAPNGHDAAHAADPDRPHLRLAAEPGGHAGAHQGAAGPRAAGPGTGSDPDLEGTRGGGRQGRGARPQAATTAVAEATEHEEWVDGMRERGAAGPDSWEPVPVPLPTYVTAPVAPRVTRSLDLNAPGTWDSGRTAAAPPRANTPLFDQYAEHTPPAAEADCRPRLRAANE
ncbi:gephyrin-like molybdotransferase receptor GlpR [Kitasatospora sp. NPDC048540]|uniref:divisome protein SepX/GlpR n=1 Tax=Kitasatospora sp. NPDC048540 TaxID=3155634 RepID=UPI0033C48D03